MRLLLCKLGLLAGLALGIPGCGGPSFDGAVYRSNELSFRVGPLPPDWRGIQVDGARLAFRDDRRGATIAMNGRCGVDGDDVPLTALTHHLFLSFTDIQVLASERQHLDAREALRTELLAELDGVPRRFVVYVLKKDGCVYDFMWIGDPEAPRSSSDDFQRFVLGFSTDVRKG